MLAGGRFYDEAGAPREMHRILQQGAAEGRRLRQVAQEIDNRAPPCNSHWTAAEGAEVWCDSDDALPRRATAANARGEEEVSCRCLNGTHFVTGAHTVEVYEGCDPYAKRCKISGGTTTTANGAS